MNIEKAIEIIETFRDEGNEDLPLDVEPAINLLIEAGKRHRDRRKLNFSGDFKPLPGETEE